MAHSLATALCCGTQRKARKYDSLTLLGITLNGRKQSHLVGKAAKYRMAIWTRMSWKRVRLYRTWLEIQLVEQGRTTAIAVISPEWYRTWLEIDG